MDIKENLNMNGYKKYFMLQKVCADVRRDVIPLKIKRIDASYSQNSPSVSATLISNSK
jgi:hypothetical protein